MHNTRGHQQACSFAVTVLSRSILCSKKLVIPRQALQRERNLAGCSLVYSRRRQMSVSTNSPIHTNLLPSSWCEHRQTFVVVWALTDSLWCEQRQTVFDVSKDSLWCEQRHTIVGVSKDRHSLVWATTDSLWCERRQTIFGVNKDRHSLVWVKTDSLWCE